MQQKTNKELIYELSKAIEDLRKKMPNGEFEIIRLKLEGLETDIQYIKTELEKSTEAKQMCLGTQNLCMCF